MMKSKAVGERVTFWRVQDVENLEIMHATYVTHSFPRHTHESFGIGIIERGAMKFLYQGATHIIPAGNLIIINPGEVHAGGAAITAGWTYRILYPDATLLQKALSEFTQRQALPYFPFPNIKDKGLAQLILHLLTALEETATLLERESHLVLTLTQLIARYAIERPAIPSVGQEHQSVMRVGEYIEAHYAENISLEQLSHIANLTPLRLIRVFRKQIGLPPHAYLIQVRVFQAKNLLSLGLPVLQVALDTGFTDQSHLTRHFKRL